MDSADMLVGILALVVSVVWFFVIMIVITVSAMIIQLWIIDIFNMDIDRTLYWTGVGLVILLCVFCKRSSKEDR